jgi:hypothetical protein
VITSDPSRIVRRFVARAAITSLGILEAMGDIRYSAKDGEKPVLIEEDGAFSTNAKQARRGSGTGVKGDSTGCRKTERGPRDIHSHFFVSRECGAVTLVLTCFPDLPCSTMMRACRC